MVRIMTGPWRDVMLPKRVSKLDLWKYYSLYGGTWNLFLQSRTLSWCSRSSINYSEEEPPCNAEDNMRTGLVVIEAWFRGY